MARKAGPEQPTSPSPRLFDYLNQVCEYQRRLLEINKLGREDAGKSKKAEQLRLGTLLATVIANDLRGRGVHDPRAAEVAIAGALSRPRVDVSETSLEDGLKLGIEIKTVNEAAGRAMWNRVGDLRSFAVNYHLKFPYAVCGGVITVPDAMPGEPNLLGLIRRVERVLARVNGRPDESSAPHRLEAIAFVVYRCAEAGGELHPDLPSAASGLRYEQFLDALTVAYDARFFPKE
jgi:hypothetical protein